MLKWIFIAALVPGTLPAQMPLGGACRQMRPSDDLNLSESQQKQIKAICKESAKKVFELREAWNKAETELQGAFDESPVDQTKANNAIEHLTAARSELFRATSQMDLKIRTVLTDEQWKDLKKRERHVGPARPGGPEGGWRRGSPPPKGAPPPIGQQQNNR
jgi:Spy/CpxP family protein refolding chaperone